MKNNIYRKVIKSKYFVKSFWALFVVMTALLICLLGYMYSNMKNVLNDTFEKNNEQSLNIIANNIDDSVSRAKFLLNAIESNALTKNFFIRGSKGSELFSNQDLRMKEYFSAIESSNDFLESVFIPSSTPQSFVPRAFFRWTAMLTTALSKSSPMTEMKIFSGSAVRSIICFHSWFLLSSPLIGTAKCALSLSTSIYPSCINPKIPTENFM